MSEGRSRIPVAVIICILLFTVITGCSAAVQAPVPEKVLKLGCIMPFSGPAAMYGERGRVITDVYIELVNEDGGVKIGNNGYKVSLLWGDDQFAPAPAAAAARKLI